VVEHVWDVNPIIDENSIFGIMLKALFGYHGHPSLTEVLAYLAYFGAIFFGLRWINRPIKPLGTQAAES
jgi:high-affinity iron transporter